MAVFVSERILQLLETEAHWGKQLRLDKIAEGFGAHGEYVADVPGQEVYKTWYSDVDRAEDIAPAVARSRAASPQSCKCRSTARRMVEGESAEAVFLRR